MNEPCDKAGYAYAPLALPKNPDPHAAALFTALNVSFADMHRLLVFRRAANGRPIGHHWATPLALMALTDTCANLFWTGLRSPGEEKFKAFIVGDYCWNIDPPENIKPEEISDLMWNRLRGPLVHRLGLKSTNRHIENVAFCEVAALSTAELGTIERRSSRPWQASVSRDLQTAAVTVQMEGWYWGLRMSIGSALSDAARLAKVIERLRTGAFDPRRN